MDPLLQALSPADREAQLRQIFGQYLGRAPEQSAIGAYQGSTIDPYSRAVEAINSPEGLAYQQQLARTQYAPSLESIDLSTRQAQTHAGLANQQYDLYGNQIGDAYGEATRNLQRGQFQQEQGLLESQNRLGLLRSGLTAAGLGDIGKRSTEAGISLEKTKANQLASLALQRAGTQDQLASAIRQGQIGKTQIENQIGQAATTGRQNALAGLNQSSDTAFNRALQAAQLAQQTPYGQSFQLPGFGAITGSKTLPIEQAFKIITDSYAAGAPVSEELYNKLLQQVGA